MNAAFLPERIFVDKNVLAFPLTRRILQLADGIPVSMIRHRREFEEEFSDSIDPIGIGKKCLWLTRQKGAFVKPCPCTPAYLGCDYYIINSVLNCPLDCSYCILQLYLTNPVTTVFVNLDDLWKELDVFLHRKRRVRIGTGELSDSLAVDHFTHTAKDMIGFFSLRKSAFFELKTKTVNLKNILDCRPAENIVISWSLNSERIAIEEELKAPPVEERIEAAREVVQRGFPVGFHFDPLVHYPGWEGDYASVIERLLGRIPPSRILWISLGSLRFPPPLKPIIQRRFPASKLVYGELIRGKDGKLRYFRPLRLELYRKVVDLIWSLGGQMIPIYLCMEDAEIWEKSLKWKPRRKEDVASFLSSRLT